MHILESSVWIGDLDKTIETTEELDELAGKSVLVTGATGLICSALVDLFLRYNKLHERKIRILAAGRSEKRVQERFGVYVDKEYFTFVPFDASIGRIDLLYDADYIIHGASNASPNKIIKEPVETMLSNISGAFSLLEYARERGTKRVLYISSSEVYGKKENGLPFDENEYGYVDLLRTRNSYAVGKRAAETLCAAYTDEYGVETVIVRPGHVYGPTASSTDNRVSSSWAITAARGENIVMKSDGSQLRSYCYCLDCASAILKVLLHGETTHAYNISNPDSVISIREMTETVTRAGRVKLLTDLPSEEEKKGFNPMSNSSLNSERLQALGWRGQFNAEIGFEHTVRILKGLYE